MKGKLLLLSLSWFVCVPVFHDVTVEVYPKPQKQSNTVFNVAKKPQVRCGGGELKTGNYSFWLRNKHEAFWTKWSLEVIFDCDHVKVCLQIIWDVVCQNAIKDRLASERKLILMKIHTPECFPVKCRVFFLFLNIWVPLLGDVCTLHFLYLERKKIVWLVSDLGNLNTLHSDEQFSHLLCSTELVKKI